MIMFAHSFAPLTLGSYCTSAVSQVSVACTLSGLPVVGRHLLSMALGYLLIPHCGIGPDTKRTTPFLWVVVKFAATRPPKVAKSTKSNLLPTWKAPICWHWPWTRFEAKFKHRKCILTRDSHGIEKHKRLREHTDTVHFKAQLSLNI